VGERLVEGRPASWFETRGVAALLTMRVGRSILGERKRSGLKDLIPRSAPLPRLEG